MSAPTETKLTAKQIQAACMLGQGTLCKDVAATLQITPQTISAWQKYPAFEALVNSIKLEGLETARGQLQGLAAGAVKTIEDVMANGKSDGMRLKAAAMVLEHSGLTNPSSGLWAWGIGGTSPEAVVRERKSRLTDSRLSDRMAELLDSYRDL